MSLESSNLTPIGPERDAASPATRDEAFGKVTALRDGTFLVTFIDFDEGWLGAQRYHPNGHPLGNTVRIHPVQGFAATDGYSVVQDSAGDIWIAAAMTPLSDEGSRFDVSVTKVALADLDTRHALRPTWYYSDASALGFQTAPAMAALPGGGVMLAWVDIAGGAVIGDVLSGNVRGTILTSPSSTSTGVFDVANLSGGFGLPNLRVTLLADQKLLVSWDGISLSSNADEIDVLGQMFSQTGVKIGSEILINHRDKYGSQYFSDVAALPSGGFVAAWETEGRGRDGSRDVMLMLYDDKGVLASWAEVRQIGDQEMPAVVALGDGDVMLFWTDHSGTIADPGTGIVGQRYTISRQYNNWLLEALGAPFAVNVTLPGAQDLADAAAIGHTVLVSWGHDFSTGVAPNGLDVRLRVLMADAELDEMDPPVAYASSVPLALVVGERATHYLSGSFHDHDSPQLSYWMQGLPEGLWLDHGSGVLMGTPAASAVGQHRLTLHATDPHGSTASTEVILTIRAAVAAPLRGTPGADQLVGSAAHDQIYGGAGDDRLIGAAGNDRIWGGAGRDRINLGDGDDLAYGGDDAADLSDTVYGGAGRDTLYGGWGNDVLYGGDGADQIFGGFGADEMIGQEGNDTLAGEQGADLINGGAGSDFLNGGFGYDRLNGGVGADVFYHQGVAGHGSDWIQDYAHREGDLLRVGLTGATKAQFQVNFARTAGAGLAGVDEAFVIYRPTGQILFALVDGGAQSQILLQVDGAGQAWNLLA